MREPDRILREAERTLDFSQPIGLMMLGILGNVTDYGEAKGITKRLFAALAPGSYVVISHATAEGEPVPTAKVSDLYTKVSQPLVPRSRSDLLHLLEGWELVEPGLSRGADWRPDPGDPPTVDVGRLATLAAVARKP